MKFDDSVDLVDLIEFASKWAQLGNAIQEQVLSIIDDTSTDAVNINAFGTARKALKGFHSDLDAAFDEWQKNYDAREEAVEEE